MTGRKVGNQDYLEKPRRCKGWVALRLVGSDAVEQGRNLGSATFSSGDLSEAPSAVNIRDGGWHLTSPAEAVNAAGAAIGEAPAAAPTCRVSGAGTLCQRSNNWNSSSGLEAQGSESRVLVSRPMTPAGLAATSPPPPPPGPRHPYAPSLVGAGLQTRWRLGVRSALLHNPWTTRGSEASAHRTGPWPAAPGTPLPASTVGGLPLCSRLLSPDSDLQTHRLGWEPPAARPPAGVRQGPSPETDGIRLLFSQAGKGKGTPLILQGLPERKLT